MFIHFFEPEQPSEQNTIFSPSNYSITNGILKMIFEDGDIQFNIGMYRYILTDTNESSAIWYNIEGGTVAVTENLLSFAPQGGGRIHYMPYQLANINGFKELISDFAFMASRSTDGKMLKFLPETEALMNQINNFHHENLINNCLDLGEFDKLKVLVENGMI